MFITFEGVDGSGKTTQARLLADKLRAEGRDVVDTREPGGTPLGERVRELLLAGQAITPWAETTLFTAARAQLVEEVIRPALARGADVVCDRYIDSSLAYQGLARGLGVERVLELNLLATGGVAPLGDQIRIDPIRALRRDLHMRPFEADRRLYRVFGADLLNEDPADALLKDLEEPPPYAVIVLVADDLGPLAPTIRSRCQHVPFRRLSQPAIKAHLSSRGVSGERLEALARVAGGRLDRAERLLDPDAEERRAQVIALARTVYLAPEFDPAAAAQIVTQIAQARGAQARSEAEAAGNEGETAREQEQRLRRAARGAERDEILEALDILSSWYRDLMVVAQGAEGAVLNSDRLAELSDDGDGRSVQAERAAETVRDVWRSFEFNVQSGLALEALFVRLRRELSSVSQAGR